MLVPRTPTKTQTAVAQSLVLRSTETCKITTHLFGSDQLLPVIYFLQSCTTLVPNRSPYLRISTLSRAA
jgi:hypothetical protein